MALNGTPVLEHSEWSSQLVVTRTLGKTGIHHLLHIITEDVKEFGASQRAWQYSPLVTSLEAKLDPLAATF